MGLIGLLIAVTLMVLGAGYFFLSTPDSDISITNDVPAGIVQGLSRYEDVKQQAEDVKTLVEEKAQSLNQQVTENIEEETASSKETTKDDTQEEEELNIENRLISTGFSIPQKMRTIDTIVLHSSYDLLGSDPYSVSGIIKEYTDYGVSAHYLIDRKGKIYRLVEDKNIAYHAGASQMPDNRKNVNDFSIGIEMMNKKETEFTGAQYKAVNSLIALLKKKYPIKSIVGHSDIAPDRKTDPWNFNWKKLK